MPVRPCKDCGVDIDTPTMYRKYCVDCRKLRAAEQSERAYKAYRMRNPEKVKVWHAAHNRRRRRPVQDVLLEMRERQEALLPTIRSHLSAGHSYSEVGERLGLTRNAIAGLVHRMRKNGKMGAQV